MKRGAMVVFFGLLLSMAACTQREGQAACYELVETLGARLVECGDYATQAEAEAAVLETISASTPARVQDCDDLWGLRDRVAFHDDCIPGIETLECGAMALPASCEGQLLYE